MAHVQDSMKTNVYKQWMFKVPKPKQQQSIKAPLHGTMCPHGACRLPCTWANRSVWHVARMSRTREKELQLVLFSSRFCCTGCAITQSERSRHLKRPSPYTITNARRVGCNNAPNPSCFEIVSYLSTWNYFVEPIISHEMDCQVCWIVASMVLLD